MFYIITSTFICRIVAIFQQSRSKIGNRNYILKCINPLFHKCMVISAKSSQSFITIAKYKSITTSYFNCNFRQRKNLTRNFIFRTVEVLQCIIISFININIYKKPTPLPFSFAKSTGFAGFFVEITAAL